MRVGPFDWKTWRDDARRRYVRRRGVGRSVWGATCLALVVLLVACGQDEPAEERRFATDPTATPDPSVPTPTVPVAPDDEPAALATPVPPEPLAEIMRNVDGSPRTALVAGGQLVVVDAQGTLVASWRPGEGEITATAVSPDGSSVGVLVGSNDGSAATPVVGNATPESDVGRAAFDRFDLVVLDAKARERWRLDDLGAAPRERVQAGPSETSARRAVDVDWAGDGSTLIVGFDDGAFMLVGQESEPVVLPGSGGGELSSLAWEPGEDAFAYVAAPAAGEPFDLFYAAIRPDGLDPVRLAPAGTTDRSIGEIAWLPGGEVIVYTESSGRPNAGIVRGRDLFQLDIGGSPRKLVFASGNVAPVAGVGEFALSPDGTYVAISVVVPGEDGSVFNSLWVKPVAGGEPTRVPVATGRGVEGFAWVDGGLAWVERDAGGDDATSDAVVMFVAGDGVPRPLAAVPLDLPATPIAATPQPATPESATPDSATPAA